MNNQLEYSGTELEAMSFAVNYHRWIRDEFRPDLGDSVAEVGAGVGDFSRLLLEAGVKRLYAFEPARNLFPVLSGGLKGEPGVTLYNEIFSVQRLPEPVDSVLYVNVMEHIEDDEAEVQAAREVLKPGGHLLIFVPALQSLYSKADKELGHFRRYRKKNLSDLVESAGFEVRRIRYFDIAGIIPWYVYFVLMRKSISKSPVSLYDRVAVPVMRPIERLLTPPIGKNLLLVARTDVT
jgi:SAM-dependent methyltransferase